MDDTPSNIKAMLRKEALARRDALPPASRIEASLAVAGHGVALGSGQPTAGYWPLRSELDVRPLMAALAERGAVLALPAVDGAMIRFRELCRGGELVAAGFGTFAPGSEAAEIDPHLVLLPLAAFDVHGNRIGYGAGFYDRAIASLRARGGNPRLVGIAFDCQEVATVPAEPHDARLDAILTESGLRRFDEP